METQTPNEKRTFKQAWDTPITISRGRLGMLCLGFYLLGQVAAVLMIIQ